MEEKRELKTEEAEQVTGGNIPLNMASSSETAAAAVNASTAYASNVTPAGIVAGAAIMIGGAWAIVDHQKPVHHTPTPTPTPTPAPTPAPTPIDEEGPPPFAAF